MAVSVGIVIALVGQAVSFLTEVDLGRLWTTSGWWPRSGGLRRAHDSHCTVEVSLIAMVIATPLGLGAAMYLSEYAHPKAPAS